MLRFVAAVIACVVISGFGGGTASAKQCRDASGKFTKCPPMTSTRPSTDAKGKFVKCPPMKKM